MAGEQQKPQATTFYTKNDDGTYSVVYSEPSKLSEEDLENYLKAEDVQIAQTEKIIDELIAKDPNHTIDKARISTKALLDYLTKEGGEYSVAAKDDEELANIISKFNAYAKLDVVATHGDYEAERASIKELQKLIDNYMAIQDEKMLDDESDTPEFRSRYLIGANLQNFLGTQINGSLHPEHYEPLTRDEYKKNVKTDGAVPKAIFIDGRNPAPASEDEIMIDAKDMPLFPHDPSPNDISQGYLGDCYMVASLSTLASRFPEKIRENIMDNGDGTVTVRFFQKNMDEDTGKPKGFTPVLVTVDKIYPETRGSRDCLWVQMMERAYAASGLHLTDSKYCRAVPPNLQEEYEELKGMPKEKWPTHEENPWLIDENNRLCEWKPNYKMIEAGFTGIFLEQFLGSGASSDFIQIRKPYIDSKKSQYDSGTFGMKMIDFFGKDLSPEKRELYKKLSTSTKDNNVQPAEYIARTLTGYEGQYVNNDENSSLLTVGVQYLLDSVTDELLDADHLQGEALFNSFQDICIRVLNKGETPQKPDTFDADTWEATYNKVVSRVHDILEQSDVYLNRKAEFIQMMTDAIRETGKSISGKAYSGKYSAFEIDIKNDIDKYTDKNYVLNAGTVGTSDKINTNGLFGKHAYSVLGTTKHKLPGTDGPELTFVRVRNPHGRNGRIYVVEDGEIKPKADRIADKDGVFEVELGDFCREFEDMTYNELSPELLKTEKPLTADEAKAVAKGVQVEPEKEQQVKEQPENQPPAQGQPEAEKLLNMKKLGGIGREFRRSFAALNDMGEGLFKSSSEYNALKETMKETLDKHLVSSMYGKTLGACSGYFRTLSLAADKYLEHCKNVPRMGSRRALRIKEVTRIRLVAEAYRLQKEPIEYVKPQLAEKLYDEMLRAKLASLPKDKRASFESMTNSPKVRAKSIEEMQNSEAFRTIIKDKDFNQLFEMTLNSKNAHRELLKAENQRAVAQGAQQAKQQSVERNRSNTVAENTVTQDDQSFMSNSL